jgi:hypothetical protein
VPPTSHTAPSKEDGVTLEGETDVYSTLAQYYAMTSGQRDRSPPSPSVLCGHPRRPNTIPGTASPSPTLWGYGATRRRHTSCCAPYGLPSAAPSSWRTNDDSTEDFNTPPSKPLLGGHRARHDAPPEARFARTAAPSIVLCAIPPHVTRTASSLAYKRRGSPLAAGRGQRALIRHTLSVFTTILALASISTCGTWRPGLLSRLACSPLCKHYGATQYSATSTPLLDVRPRPEPG